MPKAFRTLTITLLPSPPRAVICNHRRSALSPARYTNEGTHVPVSKLLVPSLTASLSPPPWQDGEKRPLTWGLNLPFPAGCCGRCSPGWDPPPPAASLPSGPASSRCPLASERGEGMRLD